MDAATLQARIWSGYGKAATRIGYQFSIYRPTTISNPMALGNIVGSPINAAFTVNSSSFNFGKAGAYKDNLWNGLFDATAVHVGDYLYNSTHGTYFVIALQDTLPPLCVKCNNTLSVVRAAGPSALGIGGYSGAAPGTETAVVTTWPANLIFDARGRNTGAALPMDEQNPFFIALLPAFSGADIRPSDIMTDNNSPTRRYIVAASELSSFGWRLMVQHSVS